jgi:hypothetical protein
MHTVKEKNKERKKTARPAPVRDHRSAQAPGWLLHPPHPCRTCFDPYDPIPSTFLPTALFMVVIVAGIEQRPIYGCIYTIGGYDKGVYYPTWVAAWS